MKLTSFAKVRVLRKTATQGISDPSKTFYGLVVLQDVDAGKLRCTKEVYDTVAENTDVTLIMKYGEGDRGGYISVSGVVSGKEQK